MVQCTKCQGSMMHESMMGMDRWVMGELHQLRCLNCGRVVDIEHRGGVSWQARPILVTTGKHVIRGNHE